jgi:translation elongation factor EF-Tu-like GTPase
MPGQKRIPNDFEASIRILRFDEGGRKSPPFNGIRWDFNYANEQPSTGLFMIKPDFIDEAGNSLAIDSPLPIDIFLNARMTVLVDEMRAQVHRSRITVGTKFHCCEGPQRVAEGRVTRITGLFENR